MSQFNVSITGIDGGQSESHTGRKKLQDQRVGQPKIGTESNSRRVTLFDEHN